MARRGADEAPNLAAELDEIVAGAAERADLTERRRLLRWRVGFMLDEIQGVIRRLGREPAPPAGDRRTLAEKLARLVQRRERLRRELAAVREKLAGRKAMQERDLAEDIATLEAGERRRFTRH